MTQQFDGVMRSALQIASVFLAEDLALEETRARTPAGDVRQRSKTSQKRPLLQRRLRIAPRLRRVAPMAGLVEELVQPRSSSPPGRVHRLEVGSIGYRPPLQVDDLEHAGWM
jgi:hypothetical protein